MQEFKKITEDVAKSLKKMNAICSEVLSTIREEEPEKVDAIIKDQKSIMKAVKKGDISALIDLQKKYADTSNK